MKFPPINPRCAHMLHGGDYNPDQWIKTPEIWDEDMRLMKLSGCNAMSIGIFSWSALEPAEGHFEFGWLDTIMDKLAKNHAYAVMATPSGSKPAWMSRAYPEVSRVGPDGVRQPHMGRHNHCRTSPVYREKCTIINTKMAERYKGHPALLVWHASNEYNGGDCLCELCLGAFRGWLRKRYDNDIGKLNHAYWSSFWSHSFPDFDYVIPIDRGIHGLMIDWERFKTHQTIDFFNAETAPLRRITPDVPVTTNFMNQWDTLDYWAFSRAVDVISWDSYPNWHEHGDELGEAVGTALLHDQCRTMKGGKPWMLMESVPSIPTRARPKKRKEPGMHLLSSLQAVAHGSDTVQYFQWRKSRGCKEKFHGAVVDHEGSEKTREFREVADVGRALAKLDAVVGTTVEPEVALVLDWENEWAIREGARIYLGDHTKYRQECKAHYQPFWSSGVPMDIIDQSGDLGRYKLVVIPMAYMLRNGFAARVRDYVAKGGAAVMTYWSAVVDESDLCHLGGIPGEGLREVFGVWEEESQSYYQHESVGIAMSKANPLGLGGTYRAVDTCSVIHAEGAQVLATFTDQYFAGSPALTCNTFGKGKAYYVAARTRDAFLGDFYRKLVAMLGIKRVMEVDLPEGVTAQLRTDGNNRYVFLMNFNSKAVPVKLDREYKDILTGKACQGEVSLDRFGVMILYCPSAQGISMTNLHAMTERERFLAVMNFQPVDRHPLIEWAAWWGDTTDRWKKEGFPPDLDWEASIRYFGLDVLINIGAALTTRDCPRPASHGAGIIADEAAYDALLPKLFPADSIPAFVKRAGALKARHDRGDFAVRVWLDGFFWWPRKLLGIERHLFSFYDTPELLHRINRDLAAFHLRTLEALLKDFTPDMVGIAEDMSYNNGPMLSKEIFDEFLAPYYRQVVPVIKRHGIKVLVDTDGQLEGMIPWLEEVGVDGVYPLERQSGVDVARIRRKHPKFLMMGGYDKMVLARDEAAMRAEFERLLPVMRSGGFIASVDHQTPPSVSLENYRTYVRLFKEFAAKVQNSGIT